MGSAIDALRDALVFSLQQLEAMRPVALRLAVPLRALKSGEIMANLEVANDEVLYIPILTDNEAGKPVPAPTGDTFVVASDDATKIALTIDAIPSGPMQGQPCVKIVPMVQTTSAAVGGTLTDSVGLTKFTWLMDIVQDTTPKALSLDFADEVVVSQPVPAA